MARTKADFKVKHDPATVTKKLAKQLSKLEEEVGLQRVIQEALGTVGMKLDEIQAPAWIIKPSTGQDFPGVPTLFLSDIHAGEVVKPEQVGYVNKFNMDILAKRMRHTVETAIHLCRLLHPSMAYPGVVLPLGGDMVSGDIHEELVATNELATIPTVLELYELLCSAIATMLEHFPNVFLPCVSGNHGRNTHKTWAKNRNHTSYDWLLYQMLARRFADEPRVTFYVPGGSDGLYRIYNTRYLLTHGDQFRGGDSIIGPIGPVFRGRQKKLSRNQATGQDFDVMICGHWHSYVQTENLIINGSMIGVGEYSYQGNFSYEPPRQALWVTHPRFGINWRMPVLCEPPKEAKQTPWVSVQA